MTSIDFDEVIWFEVTKEGIFVHSNYDDDVPIPFEKMDALIDRMRKIRDDVENGRFVFEPSSLGVFMENFHMRNCPVCDCEKVKAACTHSITYDTGKYPDTPKDVGASYLYNHGIPYRYTDWYECRCTNCGYMVWGKGPSDRTTSKRYESMKAVVDKWNECEPTEAMRKNCELSLRLKRECEERERQITEMKKQEMEKFDERKFYVKRMLGWEE